MVINRFEVPLVNLDPTVGHEIKKTRRCLPISPDEMNHHIRTVIVAPTLSLGVEEIIDNVLP
jgi:mRNA interferase MazF